MRSASGSGLAALFVAFSVFAASAESADYLIRPGDVLQIDVTGVSGIQNRMPVGVDGTVRVPLAGPVPVAGRSLDDINALVQTRLASKTLRQTSPSGEEFLIIIDPEQILVSIAEYRPVYLTGDVTSPGERQYRPGLTVRQAISLAGGSGIGNEAVSDMLLQAADFRAEHANLWMEFARERMRIARIRSELAGADAPPAFEVEETPLPPETVAELARLETERFNVNRANHAKEKAFLESEIENSLTRLTTVREQQEKEREGLEADNAEFQRHMEMEQRGITTSARVAESRRSLLMSSTRYLQATGQIAQFGREEADLRRRLQRLEDDRRSELLDEMQEAVVRVAAVAEQIAAVSDKLRYADAARTSLHGAPGNAPTITVIRAGDAGPSAIRADEDMLLMPGDVVEVALPAERPRLDLFLQN
jgi:polysaccharide biosynthesis/export protein